LTILHSGNWRRIPSKGFRRQTTEWKRIGTLDCHHNGLVLYRSASLALMTHPRLDCRRSTFERGILAASRGSSSVLVNQPWPKRTRTFIFHVLFIVPGRKIQMHYHALPFWCGSSDQISNESDDQVAFIAGSLPRFAVRRDRYQSRACDVILRRLPPNHFGRM
jgi:hypothetical protein